MAGDRVNTGAGKHIFEPFAVLKGNIGKVRIGYLEQTADQFDGVMREFFVGLRGLLYWYNVNRSGGANFSSSLINSSLYDNFCGFNVSSFRFYCAKITLPQGTVPTTTISVCFEG